MVLPLIKKYFDSHKDVESLNMINDDIIISGLELEMPGTSEAFNNYILEDSVDDELAKELSELSNGILNKISSFSDILFYIDDKDLHNIDLINSSIIQFNDFSDSMTSYFNEYEKLLNKY